MITDPIALLLVIVAAVHVAVLLQKRFAVFRSLGAALVVTVTTIVLSNGGVLPGQSPVYDFMNQTGVNIGLLLILLSVDLQSMRQMGPRMFVAFLFGGLGAAVGAVIAALLFSGQIGPETWKVAGLFAAAYTGGTVNFVAVGRAFGTSGDLFTAALASDVLMTTVWLAVCLLIPVLGGRRKQAVKPAEVTNDGRTMELATLERTFYDSSRAVTLVDVAGLTAYVVGGLLLSQYLGSVLPGIPSVLWLATVGLFAAQVRPLRTLPGSAMVGNYMLLLFFASNGARSVIATIIQTGPAIFYFAAVAIAIHGIVILGLGRLFKFDLPTLVVASQANIGASASALAVATAGGYANLLLPGVAAGLLGYGIGTYVGYATGVLARSLLMG